MQTIPAGFATRYGALLSLLAAAGAIGAAIAGADTEAIAATVGGTLTALATLAGRFAQAVTLIGAGQQATDTGITLDQLRQIDEGDDSIHLATDGDATLTASGENIREDETTPDPDLN